MAIEAGRFKIGIEATILLLFFAGQLTGPVSTNFIIYRTCYVILSYNETLCAKLGLDYNDSVIVDLEKEVQPTANMVKMAINLISQIVPVFLCTFVGPWSDKNGRKIVFLISTLGSCCVYIVRTIISLIPNASPWYLLFECIPLMLSGGLGTFMMVALCYITDVSSTESRGMRMGLMEAIVMLGGFFGGLSSSFIFNLIGYPGVYLIAALCSLISFFLVLFFLEETIERDRWDFTTIFSLQHFKEMFQVTFKKRSSFNRATLVILAFSMGFFMLTLKNSTVTNLYLRSKFQWTLEHFTIFGSIESLVLIAGTFIGVFILHKICGLPELFLLISAFTLMISNDIVFMMATTDIQIYIACALNTFVGVISPMIKSLISKIAPNEEIGKVFAFTVVLESIAFMISEPLYTFIYNSTIKTFPGAFNLASASVCTIEVLLMVCVAILMRRSNVIRYSILPESV